LDPEAEVIAPGLAVVATRTLPAEIVTAGFRAALGQVIAAATRQLDVVQRVATLSPLRATRGKIYGDDGAAARLGLKPGTLQSKMRKLGIRRDDFC
jgi:transcriptional regulator with GAF, ATPase, and Fis domain